MVPSSHRILINDNIHSHHSQRGITRYFEKLVEAVGVTFGPTATICSSVVYRHSQAKFVRILPLEFKGSYRLGLYQLNQSIVNALIAWQRPRFVYSPYYGDVQSKGLLGFTLYDMIFELFPQYYPLEEGYYQWLLAAKRRCLERADIIFSISANSARDLVAYYPHINPQKIVVTPLGVTESFLKAGETTQRQTGIRAKPYFLYVGQRSGYKNFARLLTAFYQSGLANSSDLRVISPVGQSFTADEQALIEKYHLQSAVQLITAASEERLQQSYAGALALIYPSEYEGFGLPILEAMACGTLVGTSSSSSLPEAGGEIAFYFDPHDSASIAQTMQQIAMLPNEEREKRITAGRQRAQQFSWIHCQQKTIDTINRLLN